MSDKAPRRKIVKVYEYCDEYGVKLYEVVRYEPKDFRTRAYSAAGKVQWHINGIRKVLYKLDHLYGITDQTIFVVEGEKDVDALQALGIYATCCQGSVNGWLPQFANAFKGNRVCIIPDNDETGRKYAAKVAESCRDAGVVHCILELPNLEEKGDVSDWLDAGHGGAEDLYFLAGYAFDRKPEPAAAVAPAVVDQGAADTWKVKRICINDIKPEQTTWFWEPLWIDHDVNLLVGLPSAGKTFVACHLAAAVSTGSAWPDGAGRAPLGDVVYLTTENSFSKSIRPRLEAHGADLKRCHTWTVKTKQTKEGAIVEKTIDLEDLDPIMGEIDDMPELRLLVVDPITSYMGSAEYTKNEEVRPVMVKLMDMAQQKKVCVLLLSHTKKSVSLAINSIQGAQAYVQVARICNGLYRDPDDERRRRRALVPIKNNEGPDGFGKRFSLESCDSSEKRVHIVWDELQEDRTADELMALTIQQTSNVGRTTAAEDSKVKSQAHFLDVLDSVTAVGDGWVRARVVRDKLGWSGSRMNAVVYQLVRDGILEERTANKTLPNGATMEGGIVEIRRRRHHAT